MDLRLFVRRLFPLSEPSLLFCSSFLSISPCPLSFRLTADGYLKNCLFSPQEFSVLEALRPIGPRGCEGGAFQKQDDSALTSIVSRAVSEKRAQQGGRPVVKEKPIDLRPAKERKKAEPRFRSCTRIKTRALIEEAS